jgi:N-acetylglucosaminyl-diphospho-decaprenol L-rhamnosyltransferase
MADDVAAVVVTFDALPWVEQCLDSLHGAETVVVDNGSSDGTVAFVRERYPDVRVVETENRGLAAGWNIGLRETASTYVLLLNADAWLVDGALEHLVAFAGSRPRAAVVGPRLLNPDGTLQRSVRGFPTLWRVATEYFFLRRLAPRSHAFNAYYAGDFDHGSARSVEWVMGSCFLVRQAAADQVGMFDEDFFLFSEETDWFYRFHQAGWTVWFTPDAEAVHVGGASHGGRMYVENVRGLVRWFAKHRGSREAARARGLLAVALRLRGLVFRGERGRMYRDAARAL